jgi:hypothetical protein
MSDAMTTTTVRPPKPLRMSRKAELIPSAQYAAWHEIASATAGLSDLDRKLLDVIAWHYCRLQTDGVAGKLSIERIALQLSDPLAVRVEHRE